VEGKYIFLLAEEKEFVKVGGRILWRKMRRKNCGS
jgi:hypothetical protein